MIKKRAAIYIILYLVLLPLASCADVNQSIGSEFVGQWTAITTCDVYDHENRAINGLYIYWPPSGHPGVNVGRPEVNVQFSNSPFTQDLEALYYGTANGTAMVAYTKDNRIILVIHPKENDLSVDIFDWAYGAKWALVGLSYQNECHKIFRRVGGIPIVTASWTIVDDPYPSEPSQWVVQDNALKQLSNIYRTDREYEFYQGTHIVAGSLDWTDYVLSFDMKSADNDGIGAIVRYQDKDNYYRFITVQDSGNRGPFRRLEKFVNDVRTVLAEDRNGYLSDKLYHMQFKAIGNNLEVWMDGSKILSASDQTFKSGKIGFLSYASKGLEIANVKVVDQYGITLASASNSTKGDV